MYRFHIFFQITLILFALVYVDTVSGNCTPLGVTEERPFSSIKQARYAFEHSDINGAYYPAGHYWFSIAGQSFRSYINSEGWVLTLSARGINDMVGLAYETVVALEVAEDPLTLPADKILYQDAIEKIGNDTEYLMITSTAGPAATLPFKIMTNDVDTIDRFRQFKTLSRGADQLAVWDVIEGSNVSLTDTVNHTACNNTSPLNFQVIHTCGSNINGIQWLSAREAFGILNFDPAEKNDFQLWARGASLTPGPADSLLICQQPSHVVVDEIIEPAVSVLVIDSDGNWLNQYSEPEVNLQIAHNPAGSAAHVLTASPEAITQGMAKFDNVSISQLGIGYTLRAISDGGLTSDPSDAFNVTLFAEIDASPNSIPANGSTSLGITVRLYDENGPIFNPDPETEVIITTTAGTISATTLQNGLYRASLTSATTVGTAIIGVEVDGQPLGVTTYVEFTSSALEADNTTIITTVNHAIANDTAENTLLLSFHDAHGNRLINTSVDIELTHTGHARIVGNVPTQTDTNGQVEISLTNNVVETLNIGVRVNDTVAMNRDVIPAIETTTEVIFISGEIDPLQSHLETIDNNAVANNVDHNTVRISIRDSGGRALPNTAVEIELTGTGEATVGTITGTTDGNGHIFVELRNTRAEILIIGLIVNSMIIPQSNIAANVIFVPGPPLASATHIRTVSNYAPADGISRNAVEIVVKDAYDNPVVNRDINVSLTGLGQAVTEDYSITSGLVGEIVIPLTSTTPTVLNIGALIENEAATASTEVTFTAADVSAVRSSISTITNNAIANGTDSNRVRVNVRDSAGQPVRNQLIDLELTGASKPTVGTIATTTDINGNIEIDLYSRIAARFTIGAKINGMDSISTTSIEFFPGPIFPGATTINAIDNYAAADGASLNVIAIEYKDVNGNSVPNTAVSTQLLGIGHATPGVIANTTDGNGQIMVGLHNTVSEILTLSATVNGVTINDDTRVIFTATGISAVHSEITTITNHAAANGIDINRVKVTIRNTQQQPVAHAVVELMLNNIGHARTGIIAEATDANGEITIDLTNATAEDLQIGFSVNGHVGLSSTSVLFQASIIDPANTLVYVLSDGAHANGFNENIIQLTFRDNQNNPLRNTTINNLVITPPTGVFVKQPRPDTTNRFGHLEIALGGTTPGTYTIGVAVAGTAVPTAAVVTFTDIHIVPSNTTTTIINNNAVADGIATNLVNLTLRNQLGAPMPHAAVLVELLGTGNAVIGDIPKVTDANGNVLISLSSTDAGPLDIGFSINNAIINQQHRIYFTVGAAAAGRSLIEATNNYAKANGTDANIVTIGIRDEHHNPIANAWVNLTLSGIGNATITSMPARADQFGNIEVALTNTTAEALTVGAVLNGQALPATTEIFFTSPTASAHHSTLQVLKNIANADGIDKNRLQITVLNSAGQPVRNEPVALAITGTGHAIITETSNQTNENGQIHISLTSTTAEILTVGVTLGQIAVPSTAIIEFTAGGIAASNSQLTTITNRARAGSSETNQVRIVIRDGYGNALANTQAAVELTQLGSANILGQISNTTDANGYIDVTLNSAVPAVVQVGLTVNGIATAASTELIFASGTLIPEDSTFTVIANHALADGKALNTVQMSFRDENQQPAILTPVNFLLTGTGTATLSPIAPSTDGHGRITVDLSHTIAETLQIGLIVSGRTIPGTQALSFIIAYNTDSDHDGIPDILEGDGDTDHDGQIDRFDTDSDNDGIDDQQEADNVPVLSGQDSDNDNIDDAIDVDQTGGNDHNQNGIDDHFEPVDTDGDGIPDYLDPDSDNDTLPDHFEGGADNDNDGIDNYRDTDSDNDGISDAQETDNLPNPIDQDSDNDGIDDAFDADTTGGEDANADGIDDRFSPADSDDDGLPDYLDPDSDNDGLPDRFEGPGDNDNDGIDNYRDTDSDNDGISDAQETDNLPNPTGQDSDNDGIDDAFDADATGGEDVNADGIDDRFSPADSDDDGLPDYLDPDSDNDGLPDRFEGAGDNDNDGIDNYRDTDSDNDGIDDHDEAGIAPVETTGQDHDQDGIDDALDVDITGGHDNNGNGIDDAFEPLDNDNDGTPDYLDADADGDNVPDAIEGTEDSDGNGIPDYLDQNTQNNRDDLPTNIDRDRDNDGIPDAIDIDQTLGADLNQNGIDDRYEHRDSDGDGISDVLEQYIRNQGGTRNAGYLTDSDRDSIPDLLEIAAGFDPFDYNNPTTNSGDDNDKDGVTLAQEIFLGTSDYGADTDSQHTPLINEANNRVIDAMEDIDGDGITNLAEIQLGSNPLDSNDPIASGTNRIEQLLSEVLGISDTGPYHDFDGDGLPDRREIQFGMNPLDADSDQDQDRDGLPDVIEAYIEIITAGRSSNPSLITDSDKDGLPDFYEIVIGSDLNDRNNPQISGDSDNNGNGFTDAVDTFFKTLSKPVPTDLSHDSDGDGLTDIDELTYGSSPLRAETPVIWVEASNTRDRQITLTLRLGGSQFPPPDYQWASSKPYTQVAAMGSQAARQVQMARLPQGIYPVTVTATRISNGIPFHTNVHYVFAINKSGMLVLGEDGDGDGIEDSQDHLDGRRGHEEYLQTETGNSTGFIMQAQSGVRLRLGLSAQLNLRNRAITSPENIRNNGNGLGEALGNQTLIEDRYPLSDIYDYELINLPHVGAQVGLVIPLLKAIPANATLRKFHPTIGWQPFDTDQDRIASAKQLSSGKCPAPGSSQYQTGMKAGHHCLQLHITDGGANDTDGIANGIIQDPIAVAQTDSTPSFRTGVRSSAMHPLFYLLALLGLAYRAKRARGAWKWLPPVLLITIHADANAWSISAGLNQTSLTPEGDGALVENDSSSGIALAIGNPLNVPWGKHWRWQASYYDLGRIDISGGGRIDYRATTLDARYYLPQTWHPQMQIYGVVGLGLIDTQGTAVEVDQDNSLHPLFGLGAQWQFNRNWALRGEWQQFSDDAAALGLNLTYYWPSSTQKGNRLDASKTSLSRTEKVKANADLAKTLLTRARANFARWLTTLSANTSTLQFVSIDGDREQSLEHTLFYLNRHLDINALMVYTTGDGDKRKHNILYQNFTDPKQANAYLQQLPTHIRDAFGQPKVRKAHSIINEMINSPSPEHR